MDHAYGRTRTAPTTTPVCVCARAHARVSPSNRTKWSTSTLERRFIVFQEKQIIIIHPFFFVWLKTPFRANSLSFVLMICFFPSSFLIESFFDPDPAFILFNGSMLSVTGVASGQAGSQTCAEPERSDQLQLQLLSVRRSGPAAAGAGKIPLNHSFHFCVHITINPCLCSKFNNTIFYNLGIIQL